MCHGTGRDAMKVNKTQAARMAGVGRTTFYRHLKERKIAEDANGMIDVADLQRVYGEEYLKTLEQSEQGARRRGGTPPDVYLENEVRRLQSALETADRERNHLCDQIKLLSDTLRHSLDQNRDLTSLLGVSLSGGARSPAAAGFPA